MARSKTDKPFKTFMVELSMDEHRVFKARAKIAGLSMHDYAVAMLTGKHPKEGRTKKSKP